MTNWRVLTVIMVVVLLLASCGGQQTAPTPAPLPKPTSEPTQTAPPTTTATPTPTATPVRDPIVFTNPGIDSAQIQNAIARFIVENGYGYPTDSVSGDPMSLREGLLKGDIDVNMQVLLNEQQSDWDDDIAHGEVIVLGRSRADYWQSAFVVPTYVVEQNPGLMTVQDIRDHMDVFPQEGGKVVVWNGIQAWKSSKTNEAQTKAYGLDDIIVLKDPGSEHWDLFNSLWSAEGRGEPWQNILLITPSLIL